MEEIWKRIQNYGGLYEVSNLGRVRDLKGKLKPMYKNNKGYYCMSLCYNKKKHIIQQYIDQLLLILYLMLIIILRLIIQIVTKVIIKLQIQNGVVKDIIMMKV